MLDQADPRGEQHLDVVGGLVDQGDPVGQVVVVTHVVSVVMAVAGQAEVCLGGRPHPDVVHRGGAPDEEAGRLAERVVGSPVGLGQRRPGEDDAHGGVGERLDEVRTKGPVGPDHHDVGGTQRRCILRLTGVVQASRVEPGAQRPYRGCEIGRGEVDDPGDAEHPSTLGDPWSVGALDRKTYGPVTYGVVSYPRVIGELMTRQSAGSPPSDAEPRS